MWRLKGPLTASESYFLDRSNSNGPLRATCWALAHLFQLQLHCRQVTLYHLDRAALASCTALIADRDSAPTTIERMAARLLTAVSHPKAAACVKGRFFDRLDAKLNQLARFDSNELMSIDLQAMATISGTKRDGMRSDLRAAIESLGAMLCGVLRRLFVTFVVSRSTYQGGDVMSA